MKWHTAITLLAFVLLASRTAAGADDSSPPAPLFVTVDMKVGQQREITLRDGSAAIVKVIDLKETRDQVRQAVRRAEVTVVVNGQTATLVSAMYRLPTEIGSVQIDCPVTRGYTKGSTKKNVWALQHDVRLRLWPQGSPWIRTGTFKYPVRGRWFASDTQMGNDPCYVNGCETPGDTNIYYHYGLDVGGVESQTVVQAATDGVVISVAGEIAESVKANTQVSPRYDVVYVEDARGWHYRYSHLHTIDPAMKLGARIRMGQPLGLLGKEGGSGGWSHLHFGISGIQPGGRYGSIEAYAFFWQAYHAQQETVLQAVARPHHLAIVGQTVTLDGSRSFSWEGPRAITQYEWTFTDGSTTSGPIVTRTYRKPGTYSEVLRVVDHQGRQDYDFAVVQVVESADGRAAPAIHAAYEPTLDIHPGDPITFKVRSFNVQPDEGKERWNFGDGTPAVVVQSDGCAKQHAKDGYAIATHTYQKPGHYLVRVERTNQHDETAVAHLHVQVQSDNESRKATSTKYLGAAQRFADTVLTSARDRFGEVSTPLLADGLHATTLEPPVWKGPKDQRWVLCNYASQQPLFRLLDGLTALTGKQDYKSAAAQATKYTMEHLRSENGLLYWGGHSAWDLLEDRPVGQYQPFVHELKTHQPYFQLMWDVESQRTRKVMEMIWAQHILDWGRLDYNRHADMRKKDGPRWTHEFQQDIEVPFPAQGGNLSFVNVVPPLLHAGVSLACLGKDDDALTWSRRLVYRWQQGRDPNTGLCGGQVSYRKKDRAQDALGHVHPDINEAKIVASYHQTGRYHSLPLAQMQSGEVLRQVGGRHAEVGDEFIQWACEDLAVYAKQCYDDDQGYFIAKMIDGTPLKWQQAKSDYYIPSSFAPRKADATVFWGYAMAYRLTGDEAHWEMVREIASRFDLGDFGDSENGPREVNLRTRHDSYRSIYALLELHRATNSPEFQQLASRIGDNIVATQTPTGLFPREKRQYARTGDELPLALLHLAASLRGKQSLLPRPMLDARFFHCVYHGELAPEQQKRADARTYDSNVFFGSD